MNRTASLTMKLKKDRRTTQIVTNTVTSPFKKIKMEKLTKEKLKKKIGLSISREAREKLKNT